jgi:hypothetical protein
MDAFAAFRTRQLQTNRTSFLELSGSKEACDECVSQKFLDDLHLVSLKPHLHMTFGA